MAVTLQMPVSQGSVAGLEPDAGVPQGVPEEANAPVLGGENVVVLPEGEAFSNLMEALRAGNEEAEESLRKRLEARAGERLVLTRNQGDEIVTVMSIRIAQLEALVEANTVTPEERQKAIEKKERLEELRDLAAEFTERLMEEHHEIV